ncbi:MAG TPA: hypothetical protein VHW69_16005 [Rhizomicrobium sp.]|jgi:hypothetical protein|nr:hypothetical protein [Rhizomicrobium sp.]
MKTILLASAALLCFSANAIAGSSSTISLDGFCNVWKITTQDKKVHSVAPGTGDCDNPIGIGGDHKVKHAGQFTEIGSQWAGIGIGETIDIKVSLPLVTGGTWEIDSSTDGVNFSFLNSGTYTVTGANPKLPHGGKDAALGR